MTEKNNEREAFEAWWLDYKLQDDWHTMPMGDHMWLAYQSALAPALRERDLAALMHPAVAGMSPAGAIGWLAVELAAAQSGGEPVAWMTPSDWTAAPHVTADKGVALAWKRDSREVTPLYAAPAPVASPTDHSEEARHMVTGAAAGALTDAKADQQADRQYRAAFIAGWNAGVMGDDATLKRVQDRAGPLSAYLAAQPAADAAESFPVDHVENCGCPFPDVAGCAKVAESRKGVALSDDDDLITCPECHGNGSIDVTHEPLRDGYTETFGQRCDCCQGSGKVKGE